MLNLTTLRLALKIAPYVAILMLLAWAGRLNDLRDRHLHRYQSEHAARLADRSTYESAQREAAAKNQAQIERIKSEQQRITSDVEANLSARLERLRRELSHGGTTAPQSHPAGPTAGNSGSASQGPAGAPRLCLSSEELLRAAENEERHDQLINWVLGQSQVDPNK